MDRVLVRDVAGNAERSRVSAPSLFDASRGARYECDIRTARTELVDEGQSKSRRAAGDEDARLSE
jgi:hypothetical protein